MVVFSIAGTMWVLEGLGDLEGYADQYMLSGMGEISFFQMVYFTFMTISTVIKSFDTPLFNYYMYIHVRS